jgi:hypothetical protein
MFYTDLVTAVNNYTENVFPTAVVNRFIEQAEQRIYNSVQLPALRKNVTGQVTTSNPYISCPNDWLSTFSLAVYTATSGTITTTSGSNIVTYTGISPQAGQLVTATGVPAGTTVLIVGTNSSQLSANATASGSVSATFQGPYQYLLNKDVNFIREAYAYPTTVGLPQYYALFGPQYTNQFAMSFLVGPTPDQTYSAELHYNYYPVSIIQAQIASLNTPSTSGTYTNGSYYNTALTGGTGSGAIANVIVSSGSISTVTLLNPGTGYAVGDSLTAVLPFTGGTPSWSVTVASINNVNGETWLGDEFDVALLNYSLMEAAIYLKAEQDTVTEYKERADSALQLLKQLGDAKEKGDSYRDGVPKYKVI